MGDKIDMSLDDIIKMNKSSPKKGRGGLAQRGKGGLKRLGGGGNRFFSNKFRTLGGGNKKKTPPMGFNRSSNFGGGSGLSGKWQHDLFEGGSRGKGGSGHLLVTNLDFRVSDADIQELFAEFGMLRKASVHYDKSGRSLGTADVVYESRKDAVTAMQKYNGVPLDGRAMKIVMVNNNNNNSAGGIETRVSGGIGKRIGQKRQGGRGGFTGGNRRPRQTTRRNNNDNQTNITAADLDAELDAYVNKMS